MTDPPLVKPTSPSASTVVNTPLTQTSSGSKELAYIRPAGSAPASPARALRRREVKLF